MSLARSQWTTRECSPPSNSRDSSFAIAKRAWVPLHFSAAGELVEQRHDQPSNGRRTQ